MLCNDIKLLQTTYYAFLDYTRDVKDNGSLTRPEADKKLTRNVLLGNPHTVPNTDGQKVWYHYGAMRILVENGTTITCIENRQPIDEDFVYNKELKKQLNKKLNIIGSREH